MSGQLSKRFWLAIVVFFVIGAASCGGSSTTAAVQEETGGVSPLNVADLENATNVDPASSFKYAFSQQVDQSTVTTSTFFLNEASAEGSISKAAFDASSCDPAAAVAASVTCESALACTLDPTNDLTQGTRYTICLLPFSYSGGGIGYAKEADFDGFMAEFQTSGTAPVVDAACDATAECSADEICFFGMCKAYADVGINSSVTCSSNDECSAYGDSFACLPLPVEGSDVCAAFCSDIAAWMSADGYLQEAECTAENDAYWVDDGVCLTNEVISCISDDGGEETYAIANIGVLPNYEGMVTGIDFPINFDDADYCGEDYIRMTVDVFARDFVLAEHTVMASAGDESGQLQLMNSGPVEFDDANNKLYVYNTGEVLVLTLHSMGVESGDMAAFGINIDGELIDWDYTVQVNYTETCGQW